VSRSLAPLVRLFGSLKFRLTIAGAVALALGIGSSVAFLLDKLEKDLIGQSRTYSSAEAARTASQLQRRLTSQQLALSLVARELTPGVVGDPRLLHQFLESNGLLRQAVKNLYVIDAVGRVLMFADPNGIHESNMSSKGDAYFQLAMKEARPVISEPTTSELNGELAVYLAQPLGKRLAVPPLTTR
jgi:hypothetical protein